MKRTLSLILHILGVVPVGAYGNVQLELHLPRPAGLCESRDG
jgi:hypothetical protein